MLDSPAFGDMVERVVDSPGIQRVMKQAEAGTLCPNAESPQELTACLLDDGSLLRSITDETCEVMGADKADCELARQRAQALLGRLGLSGNGWVSWVMRWLLAAGWLNGALGLLAVIGLLICSVKLVRSTARWCRRRDIPTRTKQTGTCCRQ
jgi:hypothetical protein